MKNIPHLYLFSYFNLIHLLQQIIPTKIDLPSYNVTLNYLLNHIFSKFFQTFPYYFTSQIDFQLLPKFFSFFYKTCIFDSWSKLTTFQFINKLLQFTFSDFIKIILLWRSFLNQKRIKQNSIQNVEFIGNSLKKVEKRQKLLSIRHSMVQFFNLAEPQIERITTLLQKIEFSPSMQNQSLLSIDGNSEYFCDNLESEQSSIKQNKKQIIPQDLNFQSNDQINVPYQSSSNLQKKSSQLEPQNADKVKSKAERSVFHNFQKHLVITLRQVVKIKKSSSKKQPQSVGWQIWQIFFRQTRIYTKNILHIVFGVVDYEINEMKNIYDEEMIKKFGFQEIFEQNSESLIQQAQEYLRLEAVRQLKKLNLKQFMKTRRVEHTQQFIEYVKQFVSELQQGPMRKRLPKTKKADMKLRKDIHSK